ncbi:hypothetical protein D3C87_1031940 [compost metagenome]
MRKLGSKVILPFLNSSDPNIFGPISLSSSFFSLLISPPAVVSLSSRPVTTGFCSTCTAEPCFLTLATLARSF